MVTSFGWRQNGGAQSPHCCSSCNIEKRGGCNGACLAMEGDGMVVMEGMGGRWRSRFVKASTVVCVAVVRLGAGLVVVEVNCSRTVWNVEGSVFGLDGSFVMVVKDFRMVVGVTELVWEDGLNARVFFFGRLSVMLGSISVSSGGERLSGKVIKTLSALFLNRGHLVEVMVAKMLMELMVAVLVTVEKKIMIGLYVVCFYDNNSGNIVLEVFIY